MSGEIEWQPSEAQSVSDVAEGALHDALDLGRERRRPAALVWICERAADVPVLFRAAMIAAAVFVAAVTFTAFSTPAIVSGHGVSAAIALDRPTTSLFTGDGSIDFVHSAATDPLPLADFVRPNSARDACPQVKPGAPLQRSITALLRSELPGYSVHDVGRTLDEFAALCNFTLRAADAQGTVLVIYVAASSLAVDNPFTRITVSSVTDVSTAITTAHAITSSGWSVTVGAVGPAADEPSVATLLRLAQSPAVLW